MKSGIKLDLEVPTHAGNFMHDLAKRLWPITRSLTGPGVRETISILQEYLPQLKSQSIPSGSQCFDWTVPDEWSISEAFIEDDKGTRVVDFANNNLHVVGYSIPVDEWFELDKLKEHLYSLPEQPNAIPYITSYYSRHWGFCISHEQRKTLKEGRYRAVIRSELKAGVLNYAEIILRGETAQEVLLSTYICHPSMANNELSGPVVALALAMWLQSLPHRRYTYRIVFIPETIGAIVYLSRHLAEMKEKTVAGYVLTCLGDERAYSFLPSRKGDTLADEAARHVLSHVAPDYKTYSFLSRGSDERQYCSVGVDLPVASVMRTRYGDYPEYHTSLDNLSLVTPTGLAEGFLVYKRILECLESDCFPKTQMPCEPQLGKRGLYPSLSTKESGFQVKAMMDLLAYSDGQTRLLEIAQIIGVPMWDLLPIVTQLRVADVISATQ